MDLPLDKIPRVVFLCFVSDELPLDDEVFLAVLTERVPWGVPPREFVSEIYVSSVPEEQRHLIQHGALFTLVANPKTMAAEITFEVQDPWTEEDIEEARQRAAVLFDDLFKGSS